MFLKSLVRQAEKLSRSGEMQEMILLTVARAEENHHAISPADLARELSLTRSALESHLQPLIKANRLIVNAAGVLQLADSGRHQARTLLRRHRLTERLFTDILGLDWANAHQEADRLEHVVTAEAEQNLASQLGDPDTCPHGNPIPDPSGTVPASTATRLSDCLPSTRATIVRIGLETSAALQHLAALGLLPSVEVHVEKKAPFDGPVLVCVGRAHYALGRDLAARIWVTCAPKPTEVTA